MTPAASLGQALMVARRHGQDFADAWEPAVARALADVKADEIAGWMEAFGDTRTAWAAAWERRAASRAERALLAVADDPERVAMGEIPAERDRRARGELRARAHRGGRVMAVGGHTAFAGVGHARAPSHLARGMYGSGGSE